MYEGLSAEHGRYSEHEVQKGFEIMRVLAGNRIA